MQRECIDLVALVDDLCPGVLIIVCISIICCVRRRVLQEGVVVAALLDCIKRKLEVEVLVELLASLDADHGVDLMSLRTSDLLEHECGSIVICEGVSDKEHLFRVSDGWSVRIVDRIHSHITLAARDADCAVSCVKVTQTDLHATVFDRLRKSKGLGVCRVVVISLVAVN